MTPTKQPVWPEGYGVFTNSKSPSTMDFNLSKMIESLKSFQEAHKRRIADRDALFAESRAKGTMIWGWDNEYSERWVVADEVWPELMKQTKTIEYLPPPPYTCGFTMSGVRILRLSAAIKMGFTVPEVIPQQHDLGGEG